MGRISTVFTEDVVARIPRMVSNGLSPEEIAIRLSTTVGSLKATCSRYGISLLYVPPPKPAPSIPVIRDMAQAPMVDMTIQINPLAQLQLKQRAALKGVAAATLAAQLLETIANDCLYDAVLDPE